MFARFGHARWNAMTFNENGNDSDGVVRDFNSLAATTKTFAAISSGVKTASAVTSLPKNFVEVGG